MKAFDYIKALSVSFETKARDNGESFLVISEGAPQWVTDVVRAAHGDMLPDDTRYRMIKHVVAMLADQGPEAWDDDADGIRDVCHEICDGLVDVYTSALTAWLASHLDRVGYMSEAARDFGPADDAVKAIAMGQFQEYSEIYGSIVDSVLALAVADEIEGEG